MSEQAEEQKVEKKKPKEAAILVPIKNGEFEFNNQMELHAAATMMIKTAAAPEHLRKEGVEAVAAALVFCRQAKLPQRTMNQMAFIKGKLTQYGSLVTATAERHPEYGEREDFFCDKDFNKISFENKNLNAEVYAALVRIKKKGGSVWSEYYFTVDDARRAGLLTEKTKDDSGWVKYVKDMLFHKANKRALTAQYASAIEGMNYHEDILEAYEWPRLKDVGPTNPHAAELNARFKNSVANEVVAEV